VHDDGQPKATNEEKKPDQQDTPSPNSENSASEAPGVYDLVRVSKMAVNNELLRQLGLLTDDTTKTKIKRTSTRKPKKKKDVVDASSLRRSVRKRTQNHDSLGDNDEGIVTKKARTLPSSISSTGTVESSESKDMIHRKTKIYDESPQSKLNYRRIYRPINSGKTPRPKTPNELKKKNAHRKPKI
jgi:hypothetical protein